MDNPILTTKLNRPPTRENLVERGALLDLLDEGLSADRHLILISAPAGCGKSTLAAEWMARLHEHGVSTAWLTIDGGDNNPVLFLRYLVEAFRRVYPDMGRELLALLDLPALPPVEALLTNLINELADSPGDLVMVLDDFHTITSDFVQQLVQYLFSHAPCGLHLAILTRQDPPFALAKSRATGQLVEIRKVDLDFSTLESKEFLNRYMGLDLKEDQIDHLISRTEGWITGLQIAALSLRGRRNVDEFLASYDGSHHFLFDYMAEEVLRSQSKPVIDFLIQTSFLSRLCASLCDAVTGNHDGQAILHYLEQNNLFLNPLDEQRKWYRYHPLFAEFLRQNLDPARRADLALTASGWCEKNTTLPEAISYALFAQDASATTRLIRLAAPGALRSGSVAALNDWLDALPETTLKHAPDLLILKGTTLMLRNQIETAGHYAEMAERAAGADLADKDRGLLLGLKAYLAHARYAEEEAGLLGNEAVRLLEDDPSVFKVMVLSMLGQVQRQLGDPRAGETTIREALRSGDSSGISLGGVAAGANLIAILDVLGRRRDAERYCEDTILKMADNGHAHPLSFIINIPWGMVAYEANRLDQARALLTQGFEDCRRLGFNPIMIGGLPTMALIRSAHGDTPGAIVEARAIYQEASRYQVTWVARMARVLEVNLALRQGDIIPIETWLSTAGLDEANPELGREEEYVSLARYQVAIGQDDRAIHLLEKLAASARDQGRQRSLITCDILLALAHYGQENREGTLLFLCEAVGLAAPQDYRRLFLDEDKMVYDLLLFCQKDDGFKKRFGFTSETFIAELIEAFNQDPQNSVSSLSDQRVIHPGLVEPLSPREQEVLSLIAQGFSNPEIAQKLFLSTNTLKAHTGSIYGKLDVHNRMAAVVKARVLGLIKP